MGCCLHTNCYIHILGYHVLPYAHSPPNTSVTLRPFRANSHISNVFLSILVLNESLLGLFPEAAIYLTEVKYIIIISSLIKQRS